MRTETTTTGSARERAVGQIAKKFQPGSVITARVTEADEYDLWAEAS
jgi:hypothetical protein